MALDVAKKIKNNFRDKVDLSIYTLDSEEAKKYEIRGSTAVFVDGSPVSIKTAISYERFESFLNERLQDKGV